SRSASPGGANPIPLRHAVLPNSVKHQDFSSTDNMNRRRKVVSNPRSAVSFSITPMADASGVSSNKLRITPIQWVICVVAAIGFAFDIYALLVLPQIGRASCRERVEISVAAE